MRAFKLGRVIVQLRTRSHNVIFIAKSVSGMFERPFIFQHLDFANALYAFKCGGQILLISIFLIIICLQLIYNSLYLVSIFFRPYERGTYLYIRFSVCQDHTQY